MNLRASGLFYLVPLRAYSEWTKMSVAPFPRTHHLDKYAADFIPRLAERDPNELLTTEAVSRLLHVSIQWLEIGRIRDYGPPWVKVGPRMVRYPNGKLVKWLVARSMRPAVAPRRRAGGKR
jgi:hypothetical protein